MLYESVSSFLYCEFENAYISLDNEFFLSVLDTQLLVTATKNSLPFWGSALVIE